MAGQGGVLIRDGVASLIYSTLFAPTCVSKHHPLSSLSSTQFVLQRENGGEGLQRTSFSLRERWAPLPSAINQRIHLLIRSCGEGFMSHHSFLGNFVSNAEKFYLRLILKRFVPFCNSSNTPREKFYPLLNAILADNDLLCSVFTPVLFGVHNPGKSDACTRCPRARSEREGEWCSVAC